MWAWEILGKQAAKVGLEPLNGGKGARSTPRRLFLIIAPQAQISTGSTTGGRGGGRETEQAKGQK